MSIVLLDIHTFFCRREHQLDSVELVDFTRAGIIINSRNICMWKLLLECLDNALSDNVVRQTRKRLDAYNSVNAAL